MVIEQDKLDADYISVYVGEERFSPLDYHSFGFGGFRYTTAIQPGETEEQAFTRAWDFLSKMKREKFLEARNDFYKRLGLSRPQDAE